MDILNLVKKARSEQASFKKHIVRKLSVENKERYLNGLSLLMNVDLDISEKEKDYLGILINSFDLPSEKINQFVEFAKNPPQDVVRDMMKVFDSREIKFSFILDCLMLSYRDDTFHPNEKALIDEYFSMLGLDENDKEAIINLYENVRDKNRRGVIKSLSSERIPDKEVFSYFLEYHGLDPEFLESGNWICEAGNAEFEPRANFVSLALNNRMWIFSGKDGKSFLDTIWSSSDGKQWNRSENIENFPHRAKHAGVIYDNQAYLFGGEDHRKYLNDCIRSADGEKWVIAKSYIEETFSRCDHSACVFNRDICVTGGNLRNKPMADVWVSKYGSEWEHFFQGNHFFTPRMNHSTTAFKDKIWIIGGQNEKVALNDIWVSEDMKNWEQLAINLPFKKRYGHTCEVFDNHIWIIGGRNENEFFNDVWFSYDGINWKKLKTDNDFQPRAFHQSVVFDNTLWVIGGIDSGNEFLNDVWCLGND